MVEAYAGVRNVTLASVGTEQDLDGWRKIENGLKRALADVQPSPNLQGLSYVLLAAMLTAGVIYSLLNGRQEIAQAFSRDDAHVKRFQSPRPVATPAIRSCAEIPR